MKAFLAEALGTFALVGVGTGAIVVNDATGGAVTRAGISAAFGLIVFLMIRAFGHISGAHINPAVTLGFWAAGRFSGRSVLPYLLAQVSGALLASGLLRVLFPAHPTLGATLPDGSSWQSFSLEVVLMAVLMMAILNVPGEAEGKGWLAALAVGAVVGLEAFLAGPVSGASMNPARSLAPALVSGRTEHLWIYLAAPVLGALLAVASFRPGFKEAGARETGSDPLPPPPL